MSTKSELKENLLASKVEVGVKWALENRSTVLTAVGAALGVVLVGSVFAIRRNQISEVNWTRLAQAEALVAQQQFGPAKEILKDIQASAPQQAIGLHASYYLGQAALGEKNYDEAVQNFANVSEARLNLPLKPLALANQAYAQEEKHDYPAAAETYRRFMGQYSDHFLAPRIQLALGRVLHMGGDVQGSRQALEQLIDLYPTSEWAERARTLLGQAPAPIPGPPAQLPPSN